MGIQINGATDSITAIDGTIDVVSAIGNAGVLTATAFVGNITGNVTGNINHASTLELQTGGVTRAHFNSSGHFGIAGITTISHTGANQLTIKDSDTSGNGSSMRISFKDSGNTERFYIGNDESSNSYLYLGSPSGQNNNVALTVGGSTKLTAFSGGIGINGDLELQDTIYHAGDTDTKIRFPSADTISFETAGSTRFGLSSSGNIELHGTQTGNNVATIYNGTGFLGFYASSNSGVNRDFRFFSSNSNSNESLRISSNGNVNVYKDLDVDGHTNLDNVNIAGFTTVTQDLDVDGHTNLDNATIAGVTTFIGNVNLNTDLDVDGHTNLDNVSIAGVVTASTFSGSGASLTSIPAGQLTGTVADARISTLTASKLSGALPAISGANLTNLDASDLASGTIPDARFPATLPAVSGANLTGLAPNVGITTNLSGTFTASAGSPSTINTFGYGSGDLVVEYTIYIKNGSDFQTQKLLAMRDGTTIHSTQFAVMFSSSLLVQCDATISSGNILLRATPETGVSGSTTYKVKREVM